MKNSRRLHLIVACTDRKRSTGADPVRLRDIPITNSRPRAWWSALSAQPKRVPASELYVGDHWTVSRELPDVAKRRGFDPVLWVASAGYGLVPADAELANYSATLTPGQPDSVTAVPGDDAVARWWAALAEFALEGSSTRPRTVAELAKSDAGASILVVASPPYLRAMEVDLSSAAERSGNARPILLITSKPGPQLPALQPYWVPSDSAVQTALGGALPSLHARVARYLVERGTPGGITPEWARVQLDQLRSSSQPPPRPDRERSSDEEVIAFIRTELARGERASHSALLRKYRDSGRACEQSRFRNLFKSAVVEQ